MLEHRFGYPFLHLLQLFTRSILSIKCQPQLKPYFLNIWVNKICLPHLAWMLGTTGFVGRKREFKSLQVLSPWYNWGRDMFHSHVNFIQVIQKVYYFTHCFPGLSTGLLTARNSAYCNTDILQTDDSLCFSNLLAMGLHLCFLLGMWSEMWWVGCVLFSCKLIQENGWGWWNLNWW